MTSKFFSQTAQYLTLIWKMSSKYFGKYSGNRYLLQAQHTV